MKKLFIVATSLTVLATSSFADNLAQSDLLFEALNESAGQPKHIALESLDHDDGDLAGPLNRIDSALLVPVLLDTEIDKSDVSKAAKTSEDANSSNPTEKEKQGQTWAAWTLEKSTNVALWTGKKVLRSAAGYVGTAYLTPYADSPIEMAGNLADKGTCYVVTSATGFYPAGWVAGKVAKVTTEAALRQAAPGVAFAIGYNGKEIVETAYYTGKATVNGVTAAGKATYKGAKAAYKGASYAYGAVSGWWSGKSNTSVEKETTAQPPVAAAS